MSDTCIVCLGDLGTGNGDVHQPVVDAKLKSPLQHGTAVKLEVADDAQVEIKLENPTELIAHIKPCDHVLHNECLTPWVERANSCPICRAAFHLVELKATVGGPTISSYAVEDRQQVADLDASMFLEFAEEEEVETPCQVCGEDDNEDVLMFCDGCQKMWHTYCVDLDEVPYGAWFCDNCFVSRPVTTTRTSITSRTAHVGRRRTRGQQRRQRGFQVSHDQNWNDVWQSVWSRLNLDLDFPYEDDESSAVYIRRHRQRNIVENRSAQDAWRSRLRVAELQGAGNRFRETEPSLTGAARRSRSPAQQPQNPEEILAWDAFDQARATSAEPVPVRRGKKRKSRSSSPAEAESSNAPPTRTPIKRRRTSQSAAPASGSARGRRASRAESPVPRRPPILDSVGPSFLQSLLQEVEDSSDRAGPLLNPASFRPVRAAGSPPATDHGSPRPSSPAGSPLPSNHSSPRALSPSPPPGQRPSSPTTLSSSIQPIYHENRQNSPPPRDQTNGNPRPQPTRSTSNSAGLNAVIQPTPRPRPPRIDGVLEQAAASNAPSPTSRRSHNVTPIQTTRSKSSTDQTGPRANDSSPTRATMSLSAKSSIQKLVSAALKPLYNDAVITKDEYTAINRDVSRSLYDRIGEVETLEDDQRSRWEKVAGEEVGRAVGALKANA